MQLKLIEGPNTPDINKLQIIRLAFDVLQKKLGVEKSNSVLELHFWPHDKNRAGPAATMTDNTSPYSMYMDTGVSVMHLIPFFAHEMVHVADMVTGKLRHNGENLIYDGKHIDPEMQQISLKAAADEVAMPHERPAYAKMYMLALDVFDALPPAAQDFVGVDKARAFCHFQHKKCQERLEEARKIAKILPPTIRKLIGWEDL